MGVYLRPGNPKDIWTASWELEYEDVFHFKNLYKQMHEFLVEEGWTDPDDGKDKWEHFYFERTVPASGKKEHRIWWRVQHIPAESDYVRYFMKIDFRTLNMGTTETMYKGNKYKTWKGNPNITCEAWLQLDYKNKWDNHALLKHFDKFFRERVYRPYWEDHKLILYRKCYKFQRTVKKFLDLKTPVKEPKLFRPEGGIPS